MVKIPIGPHVVETFQPWFGSTPELSGLQTVVGAVTRLQVFTPALLPASKAGVACGRRGRRNVSETVRRREIKKVGDGGIPMIQRSHTTRMTGDAGRLSLTLEKFGSY